MSKASELIKSVKASLFTEGADGYKLKTYGKDDPELMVWVRDSGDHATISFEIDGEKQAMGVKFDKKKKKVMSTRL